MIKRPSYKDFLNQTLQQSYSTPLYTKTLSTQHPPLSYHYKHSTLTDSIDTKGLVEAVNKINNQRSVLRETGGWNSFSSHKKNFNHSFHDLSIRKSQRSPLKVPKLKKDFSFYHQESSFSQFQPKKELQTLKKKVSTKGSYNDMENEAGKLTHSRSKAILSTPFEVIDRNKEYPTHREEKFQITAKDLPRTEEKRPNYLSGYHISANETGRSRSKTPVKASQTSTHINIYSPLQFRSKHWSGEEQKENREIRERSKGKSPLKGLSYSIYSQTSRQKLSIGDFMMGKKLGQGRFGCVFMVIHRMTGALFALKRIPKAIIRDNKMVDQFALQVRIQAVYEHPNIVALYAVFDDKDYVYLVMEYLSGSSLYGQLKKRGKYEEKDAVGKIKALCKAVEALHLRGVAHRDIKPQNIMMMQGQCKLGDFGWATFCDQRRLTYCGTTDYVSPQIVEGKQYDQGVDMWCVGVFAFELISGRPPFYHLSRQETFKRIEEATPVYPNYFSLNAVDFIGRLLRKVPEERMSALESLLHPFLKANQK